MEKRLVLLKAWASEKENRLISPSFTKLAEYPAYCQDVHVCSQTEEIYPMQKPRILVLSAAGKTGMPVALQLLEEGFPVTAFVHRADRRSEYLAARGADIVVGSLTDIDDMRVAMAGARRAYFCAPNEAGYLKAA